MNKKHNFPIKFYFVGLLICILIFNFLYLYLNVSCSNLSPEQQCICYDLKNRSNSININTFKKSCEGFRSLND